MVREPRILVTFENHQDGHIPQFGHLIHLSCRYETAGVAGTQIEDDRRGALPLEDPGGVEGVPGVDDLDVVGKAVSGLVA